MNIPFDEILKYIGSSGLLGLTDISNPGKAVAQLGGGMLPGAAMGGGIPGVAGAALGGAIPGAIASQVPLGDIADAVGSVARSVPPAAAALSAGGIAGNAMGNLDPGSVLRESEREEMIRRMIGRYR